MNATSHTARLNDLITADKVMAAKSAAYRQTNNEGAGGYNPHDSVRDELGRQIAEAAAADRDERAANLTAAEVAEIRAWINASKFKSASEADRALTDKKGITLDGLKAAMSRNNIK